MFIAYNAFTLLGLLTIGAAIVAAMLVVLACTVSIVGTATAAARRAETVELVMILALGVLSAMGLTVTLGMALGNLLGAVADKMLDLVMGTAMPETLATAVGTLADLAPVLATAARALA